MERGFHKILFNTSIVLTVLLMLPSRNLREPAYPQRTSSKSGYDSNYKFCNFVKIFQHNFMQNNFERLLLDINRSYEKTCSRN